MLARARPDRLAHDLESDHPDLQRRSGRSGLLPGRRSLEQMLLASRSRFLGQRLYANQRAGLYLEPVPGRGSDRCSSGLLRHDQHILYHSPFSPFPSEHPFRDILTFPRRPAINNFFTNWYLALHLASAQAALVIPALITLVDPDKSSNFILGDVLSALSAGLAFLSVPEISAAAFGIEEATVAAAKALVAAIQQAPGVSKAIWPSGTTSSQVVQIGDLAQKLGDVDSEVSDMINSGLELLMSDVPSFVSFASTGAWSGGDPYSLPNTVKGLDLALKTFLVSTAISKNLKSKTLVGVRIPFSSRLPFRKIYPSPLHQ